MINSVTPRPHHPCAPLSIDKTHRLNIKHSHNQVFIKLYNTCCWSKLSSHITLQKSRFWYDRLYYRDIWIGAITCQYNPPPLKYDVYTPDETLGPFSSAHDIRSILYTREKAPSLPVFVLLSQSLLHSTPPTLISVNSKWRSPMVTPCKQGSCQSFSHFAKMLNKRSAWVLASYSACHSHTSMHDTYVVIKYEIYAQIS